MLAAEVTSQILNDEQAEEACLKQPAHAQDSLALQAAGTISVLAGLCNGQAQVFFK